MFNLIQSGNVINIKSSGVDFNISLATGTSMPIANIEAEGYGWEVTYSGTYIANVKLISLVGGHLWGMYNPYKQIYNPYIAVNHQTLGNVTALTPTKIQDGGPSGWTEPRSQMTTNYVFLSDYTTNNLTRFAVDDLSTTVYNPGDNYLYLFEVYNENTVYILEEYGDGENLYFQICKLTYMIGVPNRQLIYQFSEYYSYDGVEWEFSEFLCFEHVKYETNDSIVCMIQYDGIRDSKTVSLIHIVIYDINTSSIKEIKTYPSSDGHPYLRAPYYDTAPVFYKNYLIWSYSIDVNDTGNCAYIGTIIIDISNNTATIVDTIKQDVESEIINYFYFGTSAVDYINNIYYFEYVQSELTTDIFKLGKIELESLPFTSQFVKDIATDDWNYYFTALLTNDNVYMLPINYVGNQNVYLIPGISSVTTVDINDLLYDNFCCCVIDVPSKMVWNLTNTNLQGKSLVDGTDRDISISWGGSGTIPFEYTKGRKVYLQIHDNMALIGISSGSYPNYQFDWYLLKET